MSVEIPWTRTTDGYPPEFVPCLAAIQLDHQVRPRVTVGVVHFSQGKWEDFFRARLNIRQDFTHWVTFDRLNGRE